MFFFKKLLNRKLALKKAQYLKLIFDNKNNFLAELVDLFVSLIYFLLNSDKILVLYKLGWLVLSL